MVPSMAYPGACLVLLLWCSPSPDVYYVQLCDGIAPIIMFYHVVFMTRGHADVFVSGRREIEM